MARRSATAPPPETTADDARVAELLARAAAGKTLQGVDWNGLRVVRADLPRDHALDFSRVGLRGAVFENVNLSNARFADADLCGATFHNVNLSSADFRRCAGRGALFTDVNLAYATLAESDLRGAIFFDANLADTSFKGAQLEGCAVDGVRLSFNGSTHTLALKEALRALAREESYPYIAGVSADPFWLTYELKTGELAWGGFAKDALRRGLEAFGFPCEFKDEVEEEAAWDVLRQALADGATVITPVHVSPPTVLGAGFGGAEWVFVTGIDRGEVLVNCLLGDGVRFSQERFRQGWCLHHPHEDAGDELPIVYAMCLVGKRTRTPARAATTREGLRGAVEILSLRSNDRLAFGFDAYAAMIDDLQSHRGPEDLPPDQARRFLPWLGLGVLHHHGSRWAARDFLAEVLHRGDFSGAGREAIAEAHDLYAGACDDLRRFLELLPWGFDESEGGGGADAIRRYHENREEGANLLRTAAARERDALARFQAVIEPG